MKEPYLYSIPFLTSAKQSGDAQTTSDGTATTVDPTHAGTAGSAVPVAITRMDDWSAEKVADWLRENALEQLVDRCVHCLAN